MRRLPAAMAPELSGVKRELLVLVGLVLAVHAVFAAAYYLAGPRRLTGGLRLGFTLLWTGATLLVVLRGLGRIRARRIRGRRSPR